MRARQRVARVHLQQLMRVDYQDMAAEQLAAVFALHRPLASVPQLPHHLRNKKYLSSYLCFNAFGANAFSALTLLVDRLEQHPCKN